MSALPEPRGAPVADVELPRMTLLEHLEELRQRLIRCLLALVIGVAACFGFSEEILRFLSRPIYRFLPPGTKLAYLGVTDPFMLYFKVSLLAGAFLVFPFLLYQLWRFVAPGLYARERRYAGPFVFFGWFFFVAGGAFAYYIAFPFTVEFLIGMAKDFQPVITADRYFDFLWVVVLGLGLMFELPILIVLLSEIGIVTPRFLMRNFRWAVMIIFLIAGVSRPTAHIVTVCLAAIPTLGLYLGGGAAAGLLRRRRPAAKPA